MGGVPRPSHLAQTVVVRVSAVAGGLEREHKQLSVWNLWVVGAKLIVFFRMVQCVVDTMWERKKQAPGLMGVPSAGGWLLPFRRAVRGAGDTLRSPRVETQEAFIHHKCRRG